MKQALLMFVWIAFFAFTLDLGHLIFHIVETPSLWHMEQVPHRFLIRFIFFLIPIALLLSRNVWKRWLVMILFLSSVFLNGISASWAASSRSCEQARQLLEKSGIARDASEDFLGRIKLKPPYGSFPSDMDKITWWGNFKPFEFWESPKFEALWINPRGEEMAKESFRGTKCRLAKTSLGGETQPRGEWQPGMWKVIITCGDYVIDRQTFAVLPVSPVLPSQDPHSVSHPSTVIWAKDVLEGKR